VQCRAEESLDDRGGVLIGNHEIAERAEDGVLSESAPSLGQESRGSRGESDALSLQGFEGGDLAIERGHGLCRTRYCAAAVSLGGLCGLQRGASGGFGCRRELGGNGGERELLGRHIDFARDCLSAITQRFALGVQRADAIANFSMLALGRGLVDGQASDAIPKLAELAFLAVERLACATHRASGDLFGGCGFCEIRPDLRNVVFGGRAICVRLIPLGPHALVERHAIASLIFGALTTGR
jgi:hypothetical protein